MTAATKKPTKPRKAARPAQNGSANGVAEQVRPREEGPDQDPWHPPPRDPEEYVPTTQPEPAKPAEPEKPAVPDHPYGDRNVYVFNPTGGSKAGDAPIVFPHINTLRPTYHFMWKIRKLDQVQQSFEWMDFAEVPDSIQERVTLLSDVDQGAFFTGWFTPAVTPPAVGPPGES